MANELHSQTSPYLLQHADNPVHWQCWNRETLDRAKKENKPILLSIGYAACHWCHVMAHESFEDPDIAAVMNDNFINIKVDREERPDLDTIYQSALALLGEHGGWPLTMFLTADAEPFWGGTYFPPETRYGRPGFRTLLLKVADIYKNEGEMIAKNVATMKDALAQMATPREGEKIAPEVPEHLARHLLGEFDPVNGGIGTAPKFPNTPALELLFNAGRRTDDAELIEAVCFALGRMCQGGIYDHLGGGFSRYATDAAWLVPHFEKMLYDNAQLIDMLRLAHGVDRDPLYATRLRETANWVRREMMTDDGAFAASIDADSEGEEGRFYVWDEDEIDRELGAEGTFFKGVYDVTTGGNWEKHNILNRLKHPDLLDGSDEKKLQACRDKLFALREARTRPGWDDKVITDWNGLMIAAMARAGAAFGEASWTRAAVNAFAFITTTLCHTADGETRLVHSYRAGRKGADATLDDYAAMARAALILFSIKGTPTYREQALAWTQILDRHYRDAVGGYYFTADDGEDLIQRTRSAADGATPSGAGVMVEVFARLWLITGEDRYRVRAEEIITAFSAGLQENAFSFATLLNGATLLDRPVEVVIIGDHEDPKTAAFVKEAFALPEPGLVLQVIAPGQVLPDHHPARGKDQKDKKVTAYVCVNRVCSPPLTEQGEMSHAIRP